MSSFIELDQLRVYRGPNIYGPQPGVMFRLSSDQVRTKRLKLALKDGAQFIGIIVAYLDVEVEPHQDGVHTIASFTTPTPELGAALVEYVVAGMRVEARSAATPPADADDADEEEPWDRDTPLFELQKRRRAQALSPRALQRLADAQAADVPILFLPDGQIQLGYGARGWRFDPAALRRRALDDDEESAASEPPLEPPWAQIGSVPLYVVTGSAHQRTAVIAAVAAALQTAHLPVPTLNNADFAATQALLADPATHCAVIGLETADVLERGLAFTVCTQAFITDLERPPSTVSPTEWVQALGLPMLVSRAPALLNLADLALTDLVAYAPMGVLPLSDLARHVVQTTTSRL